MTEFCDVCEVELDNEAEPETESSGGTCVKCKAQFGDSGAQFRMAELGIEYDKWDGQ